jgi:hypothetical protein
MKLLAALSAVVALALPAMAGAQNGYPSYAVGSQQSIKGTISSFDGQYSVLVQEDGKNYTDNVQMHEGTVINPTGIRLQPGMKVTVYGYANGSVFRADRIDTAYPANYGYGGYPNGGYGGYGGYPYGGYGGYPYGGYGYGYPYGGYPYGGYGYGYPYGGWSPFWGIGIGWFGGWWGWPGYGCCFGSTPVFFRGPIIVRRGPFHGIVHGPVTGGSVHGGFHGGMGAPITRGGVSAPIRGGMGAPITRGGMSAPITRGGMGGPVRGGGGPPHGGSMHGGRP